MSPPLVSVIIPNYNYARYLPQAIESALAQSYAPVEVIVVDDGSQDDSLEVLKGYGSRIRWVTQSNQGVAAARNHGALLSQGSFLAFLDADDYWLPAKLERQIERFLQKPELGLVYCGVDEFNEHGTVSLRQDGMEGWVLPELLLLRRPAFFGGGSGFVTPRALFDEVGGFDETLSTSADWDLACRIAARRPFGFVPEVLLKYRLHRANMHTNVRVMERDMLLVYAKHFGQASTELQAIRRASYGRLHMILAGSYFRAGQYQQFGRHALKSLCLAPANSARLLGYPWRRWQRRQATSQATN
jgi:glycosyltransferase involved in cell wall biosynthesis